MQGAWPWLMLLLPVAAIAMALSGRRPRARGAKPPRDAAPRDGAAAETTGAGVRIRFSDTATELLHIAFYRTAFGDELLETSVLSSERELLRAIHGSLREVVGDRQYFPRKPLIIPQLLRAIKSDEASKKQLVDIIVQDPVLTADVLRLANNAHYRRSAEAVDTLGRALSLLGMDGLRSLVSTSLLQPVFRVPRGYFGRFSDTVWQQTSLSALAAQAYARRSGSCDSFTAHLTALLLSVGTIVLFRLTVDKHGRISTDPPQAELFVRVLDEGADALSRAIAKDWDLAPQILTALDEHVRKLDVDRMSALGRTVYYGRLFGTAALLHRHRKLQQTEIRGLMLAKGLRGDDFDGIWPLLSSAA